MRLRLSGKGIEMTAELRELVRRRVDVALGRFAGRLEQVFVRLGDVNGPRAGVDKYCDIGIEAGLPRPLMIRERQGSLPAALSVACKRAGRAVRRQLELARVGRRRTGTRLREA
jgi:putative sigma-54 modulation protein